jgi:hypothetical protein
LPYFLHRSIHLAILILENSKIFDFLCKMIRIALFIIFADAKKHAEAGTDSADRLAGDVNFGAGYSLDDGSHDELALEGSDLFGLCVTWVLQGYVAVKSRLPNRFFSRGFIRGNKEILC